MKKLAILLAALLVLSLVSGCGLFSKTLETDKGSISLTDKGVEVKDKETGSTTQVNVATEEGDKVSLPSDYPKDLVPIMDDAKIASAMKNEDANKKATYWVTFETGKTAKEAWDFYLDALKDATETNKFEAGGTYTFSGVKGENKVGVIVAGDEREGKKFTGVTITIEPK